MSLRFFRGRDVSNMESTENIRVPSRVPMSVDEENAVANAVSPSSPLPPSASSAFDHGSHLALEKAYNDVKRRLKESSAQNPFLIPKIKTLQSAVNGTIGGDPAGADRVDEAVGNDQEEAGLQMAAEEGFTNNLQRQLARARMQLQAMETKYQEKVQENERSMFAVRGQLQEALAQVELLNKERAILHQKYEDEKEEKEAALQMVKDAKEKCDGLQLDKEKLIKEEAILHDSLRKAHRDLAVLRERQGEVTPSENCQELSDEVAYMRGVIKNLKDMVLEQRERLGSCNKTRSLSSSQRFLPPTMSRSLLELGNAESDASPVSQGQGAGSYSGQSWEMVNISHPPSLSARQQQEQQQQQQLKAMQQRCVTSSSSGLHPYWAPHNTAVNSSMTKPIMAKGKASGDRAPVISNGGLSKGWGSQSAVVQRQPNHNISLPRKSRTEVLRTTAANASEPPDFTDGSCNLPQVPGKRQMSQSPVPRLTSPQETAAGHVGQITESVQGVTAFSKPFSAAGHGNSAVYPQQPPRNVLQNSPNLSNLDASNTTAPSMHILNPGVMAGARVIRNSSDSFGSGGVTTVIGAPLLRGLSPADLLHRPVSGHLPQENDDRMQGNCDPQFELSTLGETNPTNAPHSSQAAAGLDRKCPVCGLDFSHISMDEFQSHVFECFDNAEENSMAPETLQPQAAATSEAEGRERTCPVCEKTFFDDVSQQYFEGHVQSHFEPIAEQFEVLEVKEP